MSSDFSRTLALLRREKKISQRKAATELSVSQALLSHYENGLREPGLSFVAKAADFYGVSCDYLLGRSMTPEGSAVSAEQIPDLTQTKDNVLKGSVSAMLHKKLLVNSVAVLIELAARFGSKQLISEISTYLSLAIYNMFRSLYSAGDLNDEAAFRTDINDSQALCDCRMKMASLRVFKASRGLSGFGVTAEDVKQVDMSPKSISADFPGISQSLFSLLQTTTETITKIEDDK